MKNNYDLIQLVNRQINNFWAVDITDSIESVLDKTLMRIQQDFQAVNNKYIYNDDNSLLRPIHSVSWSIFLYFLSHELYKHGEESADYVYYLNKIMHSNDWFYAADIPTHFWAEHPLGSVLGRAQYGDFLMIYQGCTIGGNQKGSELYYPKLGHHFMMFANSTVLGNSKIGNWVILSAGTYVKDEIIPDNCIVFGRSPHIVIKKRTHVEMEEIFSSVWKKP